ncbi:MAG: hypothetical protein JWM76_2450 [Pseudonocardiales bacterium]|jgi:hypothetical protein|nr:hypothetical protein [Pseudonocardiales bacterium]
MLVVFVLLVGITLWLWALFDCVTTPREQVAFLPKPIWIAVIVLLTWLGAIAWFWFGRSRAGARPPAWRSLQPTPRAARSPRPGRPSRAPIGPDDDPDFLRKL